MHFILLFLACCCCSCTHNLIQEFKIENLLNKKIKVNKIHGTIINGRYQPEDGSFSVMAHGAEARHTRISESKSDDHLSVTFEVLYYNPAISYDVFPINDSKAYLRMVFNPDAQIQMLNGFFHEILMPSYLEKHSEIQVMDEDIVSDEDGVYYIAILKGDIAPFFNLATGKHGEDYAGVLLTIKDKFLIAITLQNGILPVVEDCESAKKRLLPFLIQYINDFCPMPR